jgi:hypothetical protein
MSQDKIMRRVMAQPVRRANPDGYSKMVESVSDYFP